MFSRMKNPFRPKPRPVPDVLRQEEALFVLVFEQKGEDYRVLRHSVSRATRPLIKVGMWLSPLLLLLQLPWLWSQIQITGWTLATLGNNWLAPLLAFSPGYILWQRWNERRRFIAFAKRFPFRTLIAFPSGCGLFVSNERGELLQPPMTVFFTLWKDVIFHSNTDERAIIIAKGPWGILISNRIFRCSIDVAESSRILDGLLAPPATNSAPIAEPH